MAARKTAAKMYVLDTNVLIHDPASIHKFEEHQVVIPMTVLEELDKLKIGKAGIATDCREAIRQIDQIIQLADDGHSPLRTIPSAQGRAYE